ncbi:unnamed protein product [Agarophyton chilense]
MCSTPSHKDGPLPEPIRVRSVPPYGRPTAEEYAYMFNNYAGGVNPLGYKGHEFAPDGSYGYRYREPPRRPAKPARRPTTSLPPQPRPSTFDVGFDDEAVLSMPIPEEMRNELQRSFHHPQDLDDSCCPLITSSSGAITLPWACVTQSTVLNRYLFVTWRCILLALSVTSLVISFVYGITTASMIVASAFTVTVMKEIAISFALISYYMKRCPMWKESDVLWIVGAMFQIATHVTLASPIVLFNNYLLGTSRSEAVTELIRSPTAYFLGVQFFVVLLDIFFTPLPPGLYSILVGSLVIGFSGVASVIDTSAAGFFVALGILAASSFGLGLLVHIAIAAVYFYFHASRVTRMLNSSRVKEATDETFSDLGYS